MYPIGFRDANQFLDVRKKAVQNILADLTKILAGLTNFFARFLGLVFIKGFCKMS